MAEKTTKVSTLTKATEPPLWLKQLIDKPGLPEVLTATGVFTLLGSFAIFNQTSPDSLSFLLALGVGFTMYWLNRKEQRLGRSFLLTLGSLAIGFIVGSLLLQVGLATVGLTPIAITTLVILVFFWLTGTFLR
jgi:type III secretory pathway component EscR